MLRLNDSHDGEPAVDHTIDAASGFPIIIVEDDQPINNALPAWDVAAGLYISNGVTATDLVRISSGKGWQITLALSDVTLATVGNLGHIAEVQPTGSTRGALGNGLYGAHGLSFATSDGREIMVVVISNRHRPGLSQATGLNENLEMFGPMLEVELSTQGGRFEAPEATDAVLGPWFSALMKRGWSTVPR